MILVGNQRGGAKDLALHLMKEENDHVELHELRGFAAQDLSGALNEAYAVSRGTKCKQFLYSLSLNPPKTENVSTADFIGAVERAEEQLGLNDQPRAIVFHEKEGRRHCHAVWSRIDIETMRARQMSFDHRKLESLSRELFLDHEWQLPPGLAENSKGDPRNYTLAEYQQARRAGKDARDVKTAIQDAWSISDSKAAFSHALEERGYVLARGDRRSFVAVDYQGEVYAVPRWADVKTRQVRERLGEGDDLPSVAQAKHRIAEDMGQTLEGYRRELEAAQNKLRKDFADRRRTLVVRQRALRETLRQKQEVRKLDEARERQARFRTGVKGLWDRLHGEHGRIRKLNEDEARAAETRDRDELDALSFRQLAERRHLDSIRLRVRRMHDAKTRFLDTEVEGYDRMREAEDEPTRPRRRTRRGQGPEPGPEL